MKTIKPKIPKPTINMPRKPSFGIKFMRVKGVINPLRFPAKQA